MLAKTKNALLSPVSVLLKLFYRTSFRKDMLDTYLQAEAF